MHTLPVDRLTELTGRRGAVLFDGAMGTELLARGAPSESCLEELNLTAPALVRAIHRDYIAAGADGIETNTFGANRFRLGEHYLEARVREINDAGARLAIEARNASGRPVLVAGSVGPLGRPVEPIGAIKITSAERIFREQVTALRDAGVDLILLETFTALGELEIAARVAREVAPDLPLLTLMSLDDDADPGVLRSLLAVRPAALGFNCGSGPEAALQIARRLHEGGLGPVAVMPNAGLPQRVGGRLVYAAGPGYFAEYVPRLLEAGTRILGGCCGTRPEHIAAMRAALDRSLAAPATRVRAAGRIRSSPLSDETGVPASRLATALQRGDFAISVELSPPRGVEPRRMLEGAGLLRDAGVEYANITDAATGRLRMGVIPCAALVQQQTGLEAIAHFTTRDRNVLAIQSELIGAHALGIRNVLCLRGDPPRVGDSPAARPVWEVGSVGLITILANLNRGLDANGTPIGPPAAFLIGAAVNPNAENLDRELRLMRRKAEAGAAFFVTQPMYEQALVERFLDRAAPLPAPILVGLLPLVSVRHAEYLDNEVPGIHVPTWVKEQLERAGDGAPEAGLEMTTAFLDRIRGAVSGAYVIPSFSRYDLAARLVAAARTMIG